MKKHFLIALLSVAAIILIHSCESFATDPFEGGNGVRMNLNGKKYIENAILPVRKELLIDFSEGGIIHLNVGMTGIGDSLSFRMNIFDSDTLISGRTYPATATIKKDGVTVNLQGYADLLTIEPESQNTEALFELTGTDGDVDYVVKHGLFRLKSYDIISGTY